MHIQIDINVKKKSMKLVQLVKYIISGLFLVFWIDSEMSRTFVSS
jgi:hypothetical protein